MKKKARFAFVRISERDIKQKQLTDDKMTTNFSYMKENFVQIF